MIELTGIPAFSAPFPGVSAPIFAPIPVKVESKETPKIGLVDFPISIISLMIRFA
jgi:hypothetical protein